MKVKVLPLKDPIFFANPGSVFLFHDLTGPFSVIILRWSVMLNHIEANDALLKSLNKLDIMMGNLILLYRLKCLIFGMLVSN